MIIQSSSIDMSSRRSYERVTAMSSSVSLWGNGFTNKSSLQILDQYSETSDSEEDSSNSATDRDSGEDIFNQFKEAQSIQSPVITSSVPTSMHTIKAQSIHYLLQLLFGKGRFANNPFLGNITDDEHNVIQRYAPQSTETAVAANDSAAGFRYSETNYYAEKETTSFSTTGTVKTADGREFHFDLTLNMSRSFERTYGVDVTYGNAMQKAATCDPLVINLDTNCAAVTDQEFYFDLDIDGTKDKISNLSSGSGFLALDINNDGIINDGSELFGAKSGDGFADLAVYDEDGNGWIDEADSVFDKLCIWTKDTNGKDVLCAIGKAGVGAIYLGNAQTNFSLNSQKDNSTNAYIRKTGIFLYENGGCGTIQHLDMAM